MHTKTLVNTLKKLRSIKRGVEIGVWQGANSAALLQCFPELKLTMVDPYQPYDDPLYDSRRVVLALAEAMVVTDFAADRREFLLMSSTEAVKFYDDDMFDFVFLDGDHSYHSTSSDIDAWIPKIRSGGLLLGHDYKNRGVCRVKDAVDERFGNRVVIDLGRIWWVQM